MKLDYQIIEIPNITDPQKAQMFNLLDTHYANVRWNDFITDLNEKQWAIMLYDNDRLVGFSTQMLIAPSHNEHHADKLVLFSGDTIIDHEHWGSVTLPVAFYRLVLRIKSQHPGKKIYWMLISKGLRTYKFLSVLLSSYYPNHLCDTPAPVKDLMDEMALRKFGTNYIAPKGIVKAVTGGQYLKESYQPAESKRTPVADFFYAQNPSYAKGDELVCMAEIADDNIHPFMQRIFKSHVQ